MTDDRVLITGGAGFIGTALTNALLARGAHVTLVDSLHADVHGANPSLPTPSAARFVRGDVASPRMWRELLRDLSPTTIVHLAAETGTGISLSHASRHAKVNVVGTTTMLDAIFRAPHIRPHIVLASSRAVYGEGRWQLRDELYYPKPRGRDALAQHRWDPTSASGETGVYVPSSANDTEPRPTNVYAATKLAQEHILRAWTAATGTTLSVLRLQNVYGPGQSLINSYTGLVALFARLAVTGREIDLYEDGQIVRDFVYIDDVVQALVRAIDSPPAESRTLDIGSGSPATLAVVADFMASQENAPRPQVSGRFREGDVRAAACDISAASQDLGYAPAYDLEAGLTTLLNWVRTEVSGYKP